MSHYNPEDYTPEAELRKLKDWEDRESEKNENIKEDIFTFIDMGSKLSGIYIRKEDLQLNVRKKVKLYRKILKSLL